MKRRLRNKWRRYSIEHFARRDFALDTAVPYISFTFDDFPRSAWTNGGRILTEHGVAGTYFVSARLLGGPSPSGTIASREDLPALLLDGHEIGCHTLEHLDGRCSTTVQFERSIDANRAALSEILPNGDLPVFAYPLDGPIVRIKKAVGKHFLCCRGGGQEINARTLDLNLLKAYFLDWRNCGDLDLVRQIIERNAAARGWLIFATHDVATDPSRYGCAPTYFAEVVRLSLESDARVLPMAKVCAALGIARSIHDPRQLSPDP